ncbi:glycine zipper 2TM domain-containing protein [Cupriavidus sp. WKF15]|uniref:glycine zipper 2TM domain-containing protein n=1 Tax=Cupriavidus sp. WKF15 TaxID=3032282 RepID=UPI0023E174AB|nr:glycine zipper 2TM domain-containing protein [Cupriavidus sp. WKF15]WER47822.1 glycine zipper 2TM domain-containing protein [Cupriavidus sp. WKF15]
MENASQQSNRLHPLIATAAGAVIVVSMVGVAAMTGVLPPAHGSAGTPAAATAALAPTGPTAQAAAAAPQLATPVSPRPHIYRVPHPGLTAARYASAPDYNPEPRHYPERQQRTAASQDVGTVEAITPITQPGQGTGLGAVSGAVAGGLLGHQIGGGNGRIVATVLGALGGGVAGNMVEQRVRADTEYQVRVRMEDGSSRVVTYHQQPDVGVGQRVRVGNGTLLGSV